MRHAFPALWLVLRPPSHERGTLGPTVPGACNCPAAWTRCRARSVIGARSASGSTVIRHPRYGPLRYAAADARLLGRTLAERGYDVTLMVDDDPDLPPEQVPTWRNLDDTSTASVARARDGTTR